MEVIIVGVVAVLLDFEDFEEVVVWDGVSEVVEEVVVWDEPPAEEDDDELWPNFDLTWLHADSRSVPVSATTGLDRYTVSDSATNPTTVPTIPAPTRKARVADTLTFFRPLRIACSWPSRPANSPTRSRASSWASMTRGLLVQ